MVIQKKVNGTWQPITPKKLKGIPYTGTLPAVLTGTKAGYLHRYKIYGNTEQIGTPTPENPIMPSGCGVRTENVMPSAPAETKTNNGITVTCDGNGVYTLSGTSIGGSSVIFSIPEFQLPISVGRGGQGTMSLFNTVPNGQVLFKFMNNGTEIDTWFINEANRKSNEYSTMNGKICNAIRFYVPKGNNCDCVIKPCFTNDSIYPANYIPYGYKLPLTSAGQNVDIYLGESQTTRRIKKLVLTGGSSDGNTKATERGVIYVTPLKKLNSTPTAYCTHFKNFNNNYNMPNNSFTTIGGAGTSLWFKTDYTTANDFKSYLAAQYAAGTPVTIWYVLAEPETGIVNEPLMKIDDYADTIDSTQTSVQIPTSANSTTISWAGEGLAPSEFDSIQEWVDIPIYKRVNGEWV